MDWKDIAARVAAAGAPVLGHMLGAMLPVPGGAVLGEWAGRQIAQALGVEATPAAVDAALSSTPAPAVEERLANAEHQASMKLAALAEIAKAQSELGRAQVDAVNETIQQEVAKGDGLLGKWRGVHAWELTLECPLIVGAMLYAIVTGNTVAINAFAGLSGLIMTYLGARFSVLGVHVWQGSNERQAAIATVMPDIVRGAHRPRRG